MRYMTHGEYGLGISAQDILDGIDNLGELTIAPGTPLYDTVLGAYQDQVVARVRPWVRKQGESFGQSVVAGTADAWTPQQDPGRKTLYQDFAQPLLDPFAEGVKAKLVPFAIQEAKAQLGPIAIGAGVLVGVLLGRASK